MAKRRTAKKAPARPPQPAPAAPGARPDLVVAILLALLCLAVFGQVATFGFVNYDDGQFVFENPAVKAGLSAPSVRWALTSAEVGYYPLTWLSHMLDVQIWGLNAGGHHASNVLLHFLSSLLLYLALARMSGKRLPSAAVAALFAVHPMHVESVAWISERKDTLSTLFGLLALLFYAGRPTVSRYAAVAAALAASLLSKQMLVTLPFVLLLLDYWPLRRIDDSFRGSGRAIAAKVPLLIMAAAASAIAVVGQRNLNAIQTDAGVPLTDRVFNALVAYVKYVGKLFWPVDMTPLYPLTRIGPAAALAAFAVLTIITSAAWLLRKRMPYLIVGWLWFVGTLVPVIGIVQIGAQSMADRYTYFPYIGLFMAMAFAAFDHLPERAFATAAAVVVLALAAVAFVQTAYWRSTDLLFSHTLAVTGPNPLAEYTLGQSLQLSDPDRAIPHLRRAIALADTAFAGRGGAAESPMYAQSHIAIGTALIMKARSTGDLAARTRFLDEASRELQTALALDPHADTARRNLALIQASMSKPAAPPAAAPAARPVEAEIDPLIDAGVALLNRQQFDPAIASFRKAVAIAPDSVEAQVYLGLALARTNQNREAAVHLREARKLDPARANRFVTGILRLPADEHNLDRLLERLER